MRDDRLLGIVVIVSTAVLVGLLLVSVLKQGRLSWRFRYSHPPVLAPRFSDGEAYAPAFRDRSLQPHVARARSRSARLGS